MKSGLQSSSYTRFSYKHVNRQNLITLYMCIQLTLWSKLLISKTLIIISYKACLKQAIPKNKKQNCDLNYSPTYTLFYNNSVCHSEDQSLDPQKKFFYIFRFHNSGTTPFLYS